MGEFAAKSGVVVRRTMSAEVILLDMGWPLLVELLADAKSDPVNLSTTFGLPLPYDRLKPIHWRLSLSGLILTGAL
jgi:hypothetical protein